MRAATQPPLNRVSQVSAGPDLHSARGPPPWPGTTLIRCSRPSRCSGAARRSPSRQARSH